ncbi:MAG TPA: hypothetical protein VFK47_07355 [Ktedonobacteraceae bacterium]|nr:hypothetical protein [Ktedonobacteraceae bacterium]
MQELLLGAFMLLHQQQMRQEYVRVTTYHLYGVARDGNYVYPGIAACSSGQPGSDSLAFPTGTQLQFRDDRTVTCEDTGYGDYYWKGWVDVWTPPGTRLPYNDYEWVTVLRWGWESD